MQKTLQLTSEKDTNPYKEPKQLQFEFGKAVGPSRVMLDLERKRSWREFLADSIWPARLWVERKRSWREFLADSISPTQLGELKLVIEGTTDWSDILSRASYVISTDLETTPTSRVIPSGTDRFEREREAFLRIRDNLLEREMHVGQFVAIHEGQIIDHDSDIVELANRVYAQYGYVPIYIDKVEREEEVIELPSPEG